MKLAMSYDEIKVRFMQAKDKRQQVHILAELNACSTAQIVDILRATKVDGRLLRYLEEKDPCLNSEISESPLQKCSETVKNAAEKQQSTIASALATIFGRVNELVSQKTDIEDELSEISVMINRIDDAIAGRNV